MKLLIQWMSDDTPMFIKESPMLNFDDIICVSPILPNIKLNKDGADITEEAIKMLNEQMEHKLTHLQFTIIPDDKCDIIDWM